MTTPLSRITALASDRRVHRAFHWLHLHELQLRQWQMEMIAIPAPPFDEHARAAWFLERFTALGLTHPHIDAEGNALAWLSPATESLVGSDAHPTTENLAGSDSKPATESLPKSDSKPATESLVGSGLQPGHSPTPQKVALATGGMPANSLPCLLLSAHLDTVFPSTTDCTPREDGPRILAPGACDNAAGLTALLAIAAALRFAELTPPSPILFAANVGEEGAGDLRGMRHLFRREDGQPVHDIRAAIALEGSGNATVVDRALGSRRFRITVTGPGGHSWADAAQPNPIFALAEALAALARLTLPANPRTTLHCGTIRGGTSVNSIPELATADLDLRSVSPETLERVEREALLATRSAIAEANLRYSGQIPLRCTIARIGDRPAASLPADSSLAQGLQAVDRHLGIATEHRIGSTDANLPLSLGVEAMAIGAGGTSGGIHTLQEWYDPTGRELALRRILLLVLDACDRVGVPE